MKKKKKKRKMVLEGQTKEEVNKQSALLELLAKNRRVNVLCECALLPAYLLFHFTARTTNCEGQG